MATPPAAVDGSSERTTSFEEPFEMAIDPSRTYQAEIVTNHGTMVAICTPTTPLRRSTTS